MDHFPEHRFSATSAAQYKWLQDLYPLLFDKVKAKVDDKKFGVIGGTWVEMDTNLPSGESLVRQFLYGQRFFESRFGSRCRVFVLPDTFGYSSQLPQIGAYLPLVFLSF
jgi:alpha-mannosidase